MKRTCVAFCFVGCGDAYFAVTGLDLSRGVGAEGSEMIMTPTTVENLAQVKEASENPIPLLLEGSTGCGKSACIMEAARQRGITCLRLNMSSRVTVDDLIGKVTLEGRDNFKFVKRQFTVAFEEGFWLLLDEVNLAPDVVLQAIGAWC